MATSTGTVTLRATFANDDEALFPNEFVNVKLLVDTLQKAVLVPTPAVQSGAPGDYVYLVNADNTVSVHKVTPGPERRQEHGHPVRTRGGQTVVTDGTDRLSDGAKISVAAAKPAGQRASAASTPQRSEATPAQRAGASTAQPRKR